ncbi:hypothetical protein HPCPY1313_1273 [Helicobacter pylori CPY1313]|nr:hypothetical protein HPCPY1313_1273 [Helicobacter pylori CPY1313]
MNVWLASYCLLFHLKGCEFGYRKTCIKFYWNGLEKSDWIDPYNFSNQSFNSD